MQIEKEIQAIKEQIEVWKHGAYSIGFVPTMGYLHEGHLSLIKRSVKENDKTVVSIFVNPTQFAPTEDLESYPRDFEADATICEKAGVDLIFHPQVEDMYPSGASTFVDVEGLTKELCGKSRPTHFRGVCTVVCKLFHIVEPDYAYFGQKDAQQFAVIKRMVRDLNMKVEVIACPIIREADGLAKSSRNVYLSEKERAAALVLSKAIFQSERLMQVGEQSVTRILTKMKETIASEPLVQIDYIEIVNCDSIEKLERIKGTVLVAAAIFVGKTRLIDNVIYTVR